VLYVALQSNGAFKLVGSRAKKISPHLFVRIRMSKLLHCLDDVLTHSPPSFRSIALRISSQCAALPAQELPKV
jgi:hypothetical protein